MSKSNYIKKDNGEMAGSYPNPTKNKDIPKPSDVAEQEQSFWASEDSEESVARVWEAFQNNSKVMMMKDPHENTITFATRNCMVCGESGFVEVPTAQYEAYQNGSLIQEAFPDMPAPLREQLLTGTHPECWEQMFAGLEEDEY